MTNIRKSIIKQLREQENSSQNKGKPSHMQQRILCKDLNKFLIYSIDSINKNYQQIYRTEKKTTKDRILQIHRLSSLYLFFCCVRINRKSKRNSSGGGMEICLAANIEWIKWNDVSTILICFLPNADNILKFSYHVGIILNTPTIFLLLSIHLNRRYWIAIWQFKWCYFSV